MTMFEVGIVVAVVAILAVIFLPRFARTRSYARYDACINNLQQIGLAYKIWEGDNYDILPMGISVTNGGSMEMVVTGNVVQTFLVMSNELTTPKLLYCPKDRIRSQAMSFSLGVSSRNVSYFVGADVTNCSTPQMIISGDSHLAYTNSPPMSPGLHSIPTNRPVDWTNQRHNDSRYTELGNIGLADGSVQQVDSSDLRQILQKTGLVTNRFAIP